MEYLNPGEKLICVVNNDGAYYVSRTMPTKDTLEFVGFLRVNGTHITYRGSPLEDLSSAHPKSPETSQVSEKVPEKHQTTSWNLDW